MTYHPTRITGNLLRSAGKLTRITGNQIRSSGNQIRLTGNQTGITGNQTRLTGNQIGITGNRSDSSRRAGRIEKLPSDANWIPLGIPP